MRRRSRGWTLIELSLCMGEWSWSILSTYLITRSTEELTLPRLEHLSIHNHLDNPPLPTQGWNLPRLRHVYIAMIPTPPGSVVLKFLQRYASQLEILILIEYPGCSDLPHDFWESFTALQLLGVRYEALANRQWSGWAITPPRAHPLRYLACSVYQNFDRTIDSIRTNWTYHEEVALLVRSDTPGEYCLVEGIKKKGWRRRMTKTNGTLPMRRLASSHVSAYLS